jgi:hypothetical protein
MLTIEHYNNLSSHVGIAQMSLDHMLERETITTDEELMRFVIDVQRQLEAIVDIIEFLVVKCSSGPQT